MLTFEVQKRQKNTERDAKSLTPYQKNAIAEAAGESGWCSRHLYYPAILPGCARNDVLKSLLILLLLPYQFLTAHGQQLAGTLVGVLAGLGARNHLGNFLNPLFQA